jgi:hypothetical protein
VSKTGAELEDGDGGPEGDMREKRAAENHVEVVGGICRAADRVADRRQLQ